MPRRRRRGGNKERGAGGFEANEIEDEVSAFHNKRNKEGTLRIWMTKMPAGITTMREVAPILDLSEDEEDDSDVSSDDGYTDDSADQEEDNLANGRADAEVENIGKTWGTKRDAFYKEGDESEDEEESEDDEEAEIFEGKEAMRLQRSEANHVSKGAFALDDDDSDTDDDASISGKIVMSKSSRRKTTSRSAAVERALADAPELEFLLAEFKGKLNELDGHIHPVLARVYEEMASASKDGVSYIETKNMLLLNYCINICFYLLLKASGKSVKDHPVVAQLVKIRTMLDKLRPLDMRLKSQIDQLLEADFAQKDAPKVSQSTKTAGPNVDNLMSSDDEEDEENDEDQVSAAGNRKGATRRQLPSDNMDEAERVVASMEASGKYVVPKMAATPFEESERSRAKRDRKEAKRREKLDQNRMLREMRQEFSERPIEESAIGVSGDVEDKRAHAKAMERQKYEEENFVRLIESKKDRKERERREREAKRNTNNFADFEQFGDLDDLFKKWGNRGGDIDDSEDRFDVPSYMRGGKKSLAQYVNEMEQRKRSEQSRSLASSGDHMPAIKDPFENPIHNVRKRDRSDDGMLTYDNQGRRVVQGRGYNEDIVDSDDGGVASEDEMYLHAKRQSAARKKRRKDKYTVQRPVIQAAPLLEEGEKRKATYKMLKNKGLHAHKKKIERNPRVKMRKKFEKKMKARKGQVREMRTGEAANYGGEASGIRASVSRSRKPGRK